MNPRESEVFVASPETSSNKKRFSFVRFVAENEKFRYASIRRSVWLKSGKTRVSARAEGKGDTNRGSRKSRKKGGKAAEGRSACATSSFPWLRSFHVATEGLLTPFDCPSKQLGASSFSPALSTERSETHRWIALKHHSSLTLTRVSSSFR